MPGADQRSDTPKSTGGKPSVLEVRELSVRYGNVTAVDNVSLSVPAAGAVALLGVNGAGKTSLLRAISGLVDHSGQVVLDGRSTSKESAQSIARSGIAHVPEGRRLFPNLNVEENLQISRSARGGRERTFAPDDIYELFAPLRSLRRRQAWSLSGGEQQMVAIGRALCASPRVLMMDEPTLGLAPVVVDILYEALTQLKAKVPVLLVEQATDLALELCNEANIMRTGKIVLRSPSSELRGDRDLLRKFLG